MIRIVVTGSECTGKSTLARALADRYQTTMIPEFVRSFVEEKGREPEFDDVEEIARGQMALEDEITNTGLELVIFDTDLLSTWIYGCHYYGRCPGWIGHAVDTRRADLYLLAGIDVPWKADGIQRDRGHMRPQMQALFRAELLAREFDFINIEGSVEERLSCAIEAVDGVLSSRS